MAGLQSRLGLNAEALNNIDLAISTAPWRTDLPEERRRVERALNVDKEVADLHRVEALHRTAAYWARTGGNSAAALEVYVRTFKEASRLSQANDDAQFELKSVIRNLSAHLVARYGAKDAREFWRSLSKDPLLDSRQQRLAQMEADRLPATP